MVSAPAGVVIGRGPARGLRGAAAQHAVLRGRRGVLRSLPRARRQGAVRRRRRAPAAGPGRSSGFGRNCCSPAAGRGAGVPHGDAVAGRAGGHAACIVRIASTLSSPSARVGDRFQGFLDHDLAVVRPPRRGAAAAGVFGKVVDAVDQGDKMKGQPSLGVTAHRHRRSAAASSPITTQPVVVKGEADRGPAPRRCSAAPRSAPGSARSPTEVRARRSAPGSASRRAVIATAAASSPEAGRDRRPVGPVVHRVRAVRGAGGDAGGRQLSGPTFAGVSKEAWSDEEETDRGAGAGAARRPVAVATGGGPGSCAASRRSSPRRSRPRRRASRRCARTPGSRRPSSASRARSRTRRSTPAATGPTARCRRPWSRRRLPRRRSPACGGRSSRRRRRR